MGILFDEHLYSGLTVNNCQESRLTGRWSLVFAAVSSDHFLASPFLWISCLPLHAAFFFSSFSLSWPCYPEAAQIDFKGYCCSESSEGTWVLLLPQAVPCSLFRGTQFPLLHACTLGCTRAGELSPLSPSPWVHQSWQWEWHSWYPSGFRGGGPDDSSSFLGALLVLVGRACPG